MLQQRQNAKAMRTALLRPCNFPSRTIYIVKNPSPGAPRNGSTPCWTGFFTILISVSLDLAGQEDDVVVFPVVLVNAARAAPGPAHSWQIGYNEQDDHEQAQDYEQSLKIQNALARNTKEIKSLHNFDCARTVRDTDGGFKAQKLRRSKQGIGFFAETHVSEKSPK